jgi:hypothetical protein
MSFILVAVLILVVVLGAFRLIRHDSRARARSESHRPPPS